MRLPRRPQPFLIRFAVTTAVMAVCIGVQLAIARLSGLPGLFILLVGIFAVVDPVRSRLRLLRGADRHRSPPILIIRHLFPQVPGAPLLVILFCVGIALSMVSDALRHAMERAIAAERARRTSCFANWRIGCTTIWPSPSRCSTCRAVPTTTRRCGRR